MSGVNVSKLLMIERENDEFIDLIDKGILTIHQAYIQVSRSKKEKESRKENRKNGFDTGDSSIGFINKCSSQMDDVNDGEADLIFTSPPY